MCCSPKHLDKQRRTRAAEMGLLFFSLLKYKSWQDGNYWINRTQCQYHKQRVHFDHVYLGALSCYNDKKGIKLQDGFAIQKTATLSMHTRQRQTCHFWFTGTNWGCFLVFIVFSLFFPLLLFLLQLIISFNSFQSWPALKKKKLCWTLGWSVSAVNSLISTRPSPPLEPPEMTPRTLKTHLSLFGLKCTLTHIAI